MCNCGQKRAAIARQRQVAANPPPRVPSRTPSRSPSRSPPGAVARQGVRARTITPPRRN